MPRLRVGDWVRVKQWPHRIGQLVRIVPGYWSWGGKRRSAYVVTEADDSESYWLASELEKEERMEEPNERGHQ